MVDGPWIDDWMSHEQNNKCPQQKKMTKCEEEEDGTFDRSLSTMVSCVSFPFVAACVRLLFSQKFLTQPLHLVNNHETSLRFSQYFKLHMCLHISR